MAFDQAYYQRFYFNPRTAVTSRAEMTSRARLIGSCVHYVGLPVGSILDAGCGVGMLRTPLLRAMPRAEYVGLEYSEYLCKRYGWRQGSIETFRTRRRFDLVVCYDVLQYLSAARARTAIANLARLCRGALYFGALIRHAPIAFRGCGPGAGIDVSCRAISNRSAAACGSGRGCR